VSLEERIPPDHPMRAMRDLVEEVLQPLNGMFDRDVLERPGDHRLRRNG
jgi:hypothetical protein